MEQGKDSITLNQVRAIMEMLAQKHDRPIVSIEISQVQNEIGRGSNGTIGAFVKTVRQEHINAKAYDRSNISPHLKSALMEEIDRFADNARENAAEELEAISSLNNELSEQIDQAEEMIRDLEETNHIQQADAAKEAGRLNDELVRAKAKIDSDKEIIDQQKDEMATCQNNLADKNTETINLNQQLGTLQAELKSARSEASDASKELVEASSRLNEAEKKTALAKQASEHKQQTIDMLTNQIGKLDEQIGDKKARINELTEENDSLHQKLEKANDKLIEALEAMQHKTDEASTDEITPDKEDKGQPTRKRRGKPN